MHSTDGAIGKSQADGHCIVGQAVHGQTLPSNERRAGQEAQQVDKMTDLADDSATAYLPILGPVFGRNHASIDRHDETLGCADRGQQCLDPLHLRREASVEPHHQNTFPLFVMSRGKGGIYPANLFDCSQFFQGQAQRLFDKDMLACRQCPQHQFGMAIVAGSDDNSVHCGISEDRSGIGSGRCETKFATCVQTTDTTGRCDCLQPCASCFESWNQYPSCVVTGTDEANRHAFFLRNGLGVRVCRRQRHRWPPQRRFCLFRRSWVLQQNSQRRSRATHQGISLFSLSDSKTMGDQRFHAWPSPASTPAD